MPTTQSVIDCIIRRTKALYGQSNGSAVGPEARGKFLLLDVDANAPEIEADKLYVYQRLVEAAEIAKQPLPHREEYEYLAADAYTACCGWFGMPPDPELAYILRRGFRPESFCNFSDNEYTIFLADHLNTREKRCRHIGHEMYHRVTCRRDGPHRERWIDELLAFCSEQWFLRRSGYAEYAKRFCDNAARRTESVDMAAVQCVHQNFDPKALLRPASLYPEHFGTDIVRLGSALSLLVPDLYLAALVSAKSLPSWVQHLPEDRRVPVRRLLALPGNDRFVTNNIRLCRKFGKALRIVGRYEESLAELQSVVDCLPNDPQSHFSLAFTLSKMGRCEEARAAWCRAYALDSNLHWATFNVGNSFWTEGDFPSAIEWYKRALQRRPDWPQALYYLGMAYAHLNQHEEAHECWRHIVALSDVEYLSRAENALRDYPENWAKETPACQSESD